MKRKQIAALALALVMMLSLCACGGSNHSAASGGYYADYATEEPMAAPAPAMMGAAEESYSGFGVSGSTNTSARTESGESAGEQRPEKIIYSADATVETTQFEASCEALMALLEANGGFVESSSVNGSNYYDSSRGRVSRRSAGYTLRIPSANFDGMLNALTSLGNVPYTHMYTENVTAQYYDVEARMKALQAQEARLIEMLEIAETVEDIITIEDKLADVRYRIDSLQASLNNWDRRVSYSTLTLTIQEVQEYTPEPVVRITYGQRLVQTFREALEDTGEFFQDLLLLIVRLLPTIVILAVLFFAGRPLWRKLHAAGKARRAARAERRARKKAEKLYGKARPLQTPDEPLPPETGKDE